MSVWLVEPLDPLIARDGRPSAIGRFDTTHFPSPSMVAGAVRTRMGSVNGAFTLAGSALDELKERVHVRGPLLAELSQEDGSIKEWLVPAPRDAMILEEEGAKPEIRRLIPRPLASCEALDSFQELGLRPLCLHGSGGRGKPPQSIPAFWCWSRFESWLRSPADEPGGVRPRLGLALPAPSNGRPRSFEPLHAGFHHRRTRRDDQLPLTHRQLWRTAGSRSSMAARSCA